MQDREYYLVYVETYSGHWELVAREFDDYATAAREADAYPITSRVVHVTLRIMPDNIMEGDYEEE